VSEDLTWQEERDRVWTEFELYDKENSPAKKFHYTVYTIQLNPKAQRGLRTTMHNPFHLYVGVHHDGLVSVLDHPFWFGVKFKDMNHEQRRDVYEYLTEWEFAEWVQIGPEDSELFATDKLTAKEDTPTWEP
jgi:hypothetical protein